MAWLAGGGTRSEQFPAGLSLTLNWLGCVRRSLWDGRRLWWFANVICSSSSNSGYGDCDGGIPRSRNRLPCWSRHPLVVALGEKWNEVPSKLHRKLFPKSNVYSRRIRRRLHVRSEIPGSSKRKFLSKGGRMEREQPFTPPTRPRFHLPISSSQIRNKLLRGVVGSRRFFLSPEREGAFTVVGGWPSSTNPLPPKNWLSGRPSRIPRRMLLAFFVGRLSLTIKVRPPWFHVDRERERRGRRVGKDTEEKEEKQWEWLKT